MLYQVELSKDELRRLERLRTRLNANAKSAAKRLLYKREAHTKAVASRDEHDMRMTRAKCDVEEAIKREWEAMYEVVAKVRDAFPDDQLKLPFEEVANGQSNGAGEADAGGPLEDEGGGGRDGGKEADGGPNW